MHAKMNVILEFSLGVDDNGKNISKRITLSQIRKDLTTVQIKQLAQAFANLMPGVLVETTKVEYSYVL